MLRYVLFLLLPCYVLAQAPTAPPSLTLTNGRVSATLLPPDAQRGYYRGARFDWAGVVQTLSAGGHTYFGLSWNDRPYRPELHDAVGGPVEEFGAVGYDDAAPGATFLKIGIGMVRRLDEKPHFFANEYPIANGGTWTTERKPNAATFRHVLTDAPSGYGYEYVKTLRLPTGKTQLVLEHRLTNTGQKLLETEVYNHNFFMLDDQPTGPDLSVTFADKVAATPALPAPLLLDGARLTYQRPLTAQEAPFVTLTGRNNTAPAGTPERDRLPPYDIRVENRTSRAGVRVTADRPMARLNFWSNARNLSPEPYIALRIPPGQTATWTITYDFYEVK